MNRKCTNLEHLPALWIAYEGGQSAQLLHCPHVRRMHSTKDSQAEALWLLIMLELQLITNTFARISVEEIHHRPQFLSFISPPSFEDS